MRGLLPIKALFLTLMMADSGLYAFPSSGEMRDSSVDDAEAEDVIRLSSLGTSVEMVNASDVQELRERTNANVSQTLSNTSLADLENDNLTQLLQIRYRERKRQERLLIIQTQILQRLHMSRQPNISASVFSEHDQQRINDLVERIQHINNHNGEEGNDAHNYKNNNLPINHLNDGTTINRIHTTTMQRLQSFYPSCSLPNNTDKSTWEQPNKLRVYYEVPSNRYNFGSQVTVLFAKLRLYKSSTGSGDGIKNQIDDMQHLNRLDPSSNEKSVFKSIYVTVYQYMKPLRYNKKERKRVVETKTVSTDYEGWVEFNVASSLTLWLQHSHRNYGFDVEVVDEQGNKLNPNDLFHNMNCSSTETQDSPFPNIMELHPDMMGDNESSLFDNETYPTLDLQTADISTLDSAFFHIYQPASYTSSSRRILKKRHLNERTSVAQNERRCKTEVTYITFSELGLDDVVLYPEGFLWTFCSGRCESPKKAEDSAVSEETVTVDKNIYRSLRQLWNFVMQQSSRVSECIGVNKLPFKLTYVDEEGNIESVTLKDFIPTRCSCSKS